MAEGFPRDRHSFGGFIDRADQRRSLLNEFLAAMFVQAAVTIARSISPTMVFALPLVKKSCPVASSKRYAGSAWRVISRYPQLSGPTIHMSNERLLLFFAHALSGYQCQTADNRRLCENKCLSIISTARPAGQLSDKGLNVFRGRSYSSTNKIGDDHVEQPHKSH